MDGDLVSINTEAENTLLQIKLGEMNIKEPIVVWIGLTDSAMEGTWKWVDGSGSTYGNWLPPQPIRNTANNCAGMAKFFYWKWITLSCSFAQRYICEIPGK